MRSTTMKRLSVTLFQVWLAVSPVAAAQNVSEDQLLSDEQLRPTIRAAEQGDVGNQYLLGYMYANGLGVAHDDSAAATWFRRAAERGHADAQLKLAGMYAKGRGVPQSDAAALEWLRREAEQGSADSKFSLGLTYSTGSTATSKDGPRSRILRKLRIGTSVPPPRDMPVLRLSLVPSTPRGAVCDRMTTRPSLGCAAPPIRGM